MYSDQPPMEGPSSEPYYPQSFDYNHVPYHPGHATSPTSFPAFPGVPGPTPQYPAPNSFYPPMMMSNGYAAPDYGHPRTEMTWQSYAVPPPFPGHNPQFLRGKRGRPGYLHQTPNNRGSRGSRRQNQPFIHREFTSGTVHHPRNHVPSSQASSSPQPSGESRSEPADNYTQPPPPPLDESLAPPEKPVELPTPAAQAEFTADTAQSNSPEPAGLELLEPPIALDTALLWCISAFKVAPASAFPITISPHACPPHSIIEKATIIERADPPPRKSKGPQNERTLVIAVENEESPKVEPPVTQPPWPETQQGIVREAIPEELVPNENEEQTTKISEPTSATNQETPQTTPAPRRAVTSWASLLRGPSITSSTPGAKALPTSSVVGFSIPADTSVLTRSPIDLAVLKLLTGKSGRSSEPHILVPRGLINLGNMCFANIILQGLMYTQPFWTLLRELRKLHPAPLSTPKGAPLLNASLRFVEEFVVKPPKEIGRDIHQQEEEEEEAFVPQYLFEALKENKRFDTMKGGQQEDAEEFLGFFLDALEEEMADIVSSIDSEKAPSVNEEFEREDEGEPEGDGWIDVGKHNRKVITRAVKTVETPISRIFGGRSRSTLRRPGASDSATVEGWRHLGVDIQLETVHTIEDALGELSRPETVQLSSAHGTLVDGSKQYLLDDLPPILILHLKRFHYDPLLKDVVKQRKVIHFGPELVMPKSICSTTLKSRKMPNYKLYAVLYHHGIYATGGHYTLDVLHPNQKKEAWGKGWKEGWIHIDDEQITETSIQDVVAQRGGEDRTPYLLFYRQSGYQS